MAVGDDAAAAGYEIVPSEGIEGKVRLGAQEINRTRDYIARLRNDIPSTPGPFRTFIGIRSGVAPPVKSRGGEGDIYLQIL